jgi:hypothetical protein
VPTTNYKYSGANFIYSIIKQKLLVSFKKIASIELGVQLNKGILLVESYIMKKERKINRITFEALKSISKQRFSKLMRFMRIFNCIN